MRLRMCRFRFSLGVSFSCFLMTICRWERSPMTTALSASVPAIAFEAPDVIEAALVVVARCQRLDAQVKSYDTLLAQGALLAFLACLARLVLVLLSIIIDK